MYQQKHSIIKNSLTLKLLISTSLLLLYFYLAFLFIYLFLFFLSLIISTFKFLKLKSLNSTNEIFPPSTNANTIFEFSFLLKSFSRLFKFGGFSESELFL